MSVLQLMACTHCIVGLKQDGLELIETSLYSVSSLPLDNDLAKLLNTAQYNVGYFRYVIYLSPGQAVT